MCSLLLLLTAGAATLASAKDSYDVELVWSSLGSEPAFNVQLGSDTLKSVCFDLGSSSFWVPGHDWECYDDLQGNMTKVQKTKCTFWTTTHSHFTFSGGQIKGALFNSTYSSGMTGAVGDVGKQAVGLGQLTVPDVVTGIGSKVDMRSHLQSGVMGFGFPAFTSYFKKSDLEKVGEIQDITDFTTYNPFVFQAAEDGLIDPKFGYYFDGLGGADGAPCGKLTLGGAPSVASGPFSAEIPVEATTERIGTPDTKGYWNLHIDGFKVQADPNAAPTVFSYLDDDAAAGKLDPNSPYFSHVATIDTGSPIVVIPKEVHDEMLKNIDPAPTMDQYGSLATACDATVPAVAITLGGIDLWFNSTLFPPTWTPNQDLCELAILGSQGGDDYPLLGGAFLVNVVAVHDFSDMKAPFSKFAQRVWS